MNASEVAAWLAVVGAAFGLTIQAYNIIKGRKKEQTELQEALDKAPLVRDQLEIGNVSGAVATLNLIIENQNKYIAELNARHQAEENELREEIRALKEELRQVSLQLAECRKKIWPTRS